MKKIIIAIALLSALPVISNAEENAAAPAKPAAKEHHMQNANPASAPAQEATQVPEHVMQNAGPASKPEPKKHTVRNN